MSNLPAVTPAPSTSGGAPADISAFNNDVGYLVASDPEFTEFKATAVDQVIAVGHVYNNEVASFYLPIQGRTKPTSVTYNGNFNIFKRGFGVIASGYTISMSNLSSNKVVILTQGGLTNVSTGDYLELRANSATSTLTVNF